MLCNNTEVSLHFKMSFSVAFTFGNVFENSFRILRCLFFVCGVTRRVCKLPWKELNMSTKKNVNLYKMTEPFVHDRNGNQ